MNKYHFLFAFVLLSLTGCLPEEEPWDLPEAPEESFAEVAMGRDYDAQIYFDLATGEQTVVDVSTWDLAFVNDLSQPQIWMNGAKVMQAAQVDSDMKATIDPESVDVLPDIGHLDPDSGIINLSGLPSPVYLVDRGKIYHDDDPQRYFKLQVIAVSDAGYEIELALPEERSGTTVLIPLPDNNTATYWHFENGVVDAAPPEWDLLFTRYMHSYDTLPEGDPFKYYSVTGALTHRWQGVQALEVVDEQFDAIPYAEAEHHDWLSEQWDMEANNIGFDWKRFDFDLGFVMRDDRYYIIRTEENALYKLKFTGFLNDQGVKGHPSFLCKRIQ